MNKWFVYYEDDYPDNGGVGLLSFDNLSDAKSFIEGRLLQIPNTTLENYLLIEGRAMQLSVVAQVTKIRAE